MVGFHALHATRPVPTTCCDATHSTAMLGLSHPDTNAYLTYLDKKRGLVKFCSPGKLMNARANVFRVPPHNLAAHAMAGGSADYDELGGGESARLNTHLPTTPSARTCVGRV